MHSALPPFLLIFDLDGVLYRAGEVIADAPAVLDRLRAEGFQIAFCTNNSWPLPEEVAAKLTGLGIAASADEVLTSATPAAELAAAIAPGGSALAIGGPGVETALAAAGLTVQRPADPPAPVEVVVAGIDWHFTYETLARGQAALLAGAHFIATNMDPRYPVEKGGFRPGAGSLIAALQAASGIAPELAGKPHSLMIEQLMGRYGRKPKETLVIGDQLATDIAAGNRAGCRTALVCTGVSTRTEAEAMRGTSRPTYIHDSLTSLAAALIAEEVLVVRR